MVRGIVDHSRLGWWDPHPSRKNKDAARVGHAAFVAGTEESRFPAGMTSKKGKSKGKDGWGSWDPTLMTETKTSLGWGTRAFVAGSEESRFPDTHSLCWNAILKKQAAGASCRMGNAGGSA